MKIGRVVLITSCALVVLLGTPGRSMACTIDNVASLLANGVPAMLNTTSPRRKEAWAPFSLAQAFAPGATIRLEEAQADLARSLPPDVRDGLYRWVFGDGSAALGHIITHRYARPGLYHLLVYGYSPRIHRWLVFDSALVRIVPVGQLWQANLEYEVLRMVIAVSNGTWPADAALVVIVAVLLAHLHRSRERAY